MNETYTTLLKCQLCKKILHFNKIGNNCVCCGINYINGDCLNHIIDTSNNTKEEVLE